MGALGAMVIVAGLALMTTAVLGALDDDDTRQTVGIGEVGDDATTTTTDREPSIRRSTTTTAAEPEVLAETTERDPGASPSTTTPAAPTTTLAPRPPAATPTTAPAPPASPTTTICRDSADPACGPLVWDPAPGPYDVDVEEVSVPRRATVGEEVTFEVDYVERAGADAIGACASWAARTDPGVPNVSTCEAVNHSCDRYGPHQPPPASDDRVRVARTVTFTTPGEHEVTVGGHTATHLPDGCANPYLASWSRTYVVEVGAA